MNEKNGGVMSIRIAAVSSTTVRGDDEERNVARAVEYVAEAAARGAQIVCFPEGYPGPYNGPATYSALEPLGAAAAEHGVYIIAGMVERADDLEGEVYRLASRLFDPAGQVAGTYRRVLPNPTGMCDVLMGGKAIVPGDELPVFQTELGTIGMLVCSEAWSPELPLTLALRGADILFAPIGGAVYELYDHWKAILRARAYENCMYVVTCQNIWGVEDSMGMIVGPDGVVAESVDSGVLIGDVDLARLKWLRGQTQSLELPKPYRSIPGLLRHRRPDLYGEITAPREDLYDFWTATTDDSPAADGMSAGSAQTSR